MLSRQKARHDSTFDLIAEKELKATRRCRLYESARAYSG